MSENEPLVSILVPAYNHQHYVTQALRSVIAQTYQNIELLVINDGSPDDTAQVIEQLMPECEQRFSNVIFKDRANVGVVKTLNEGIALANGEFLATMPSDDAYQPDAIQALVNFLSVQNDYVIAVGDNLIMNDDGELCYWDKKRRNISNKSEAVYVSFCDFLKQSRRDVDFSTDTFGSYESLLKGNYIPNGYLMRLSVLKQFGYSEKSQIEDHNLMLQFAKHGKMKFIDQPTYLYRWHDSNLIKSLGGLNEKALQNLRMEQEYCSARPELKRIWQAECDKLRERRGFAKVLHKWKRSLFKRFGK